MIKNIAYLVVFLIISSCSNPEPRKPIIRKTGSFLEKSVKRNITINKIEEGLLKSKMKKDSLHHFINSKNGFWYFYQVKDTLKSETPKKGDLAIFTYEVKNLNDQIIFSKEETGKIQYYVGKQEMISGLHDGIQLMKEGEKVTFLFPSYKAYGYSGNEKVNPNQPLIFTVELLKINKIK